MKPRGNLIPAHNKGSNVPLIMVHGDECINILSNSLPAEQPFYYFIHLGSDGELIHLESVEEYASYYIEQVKKEIPNGPYILAGYSFGGHVAYKMAAELLKKNEEVLGVILLDSGLPATFTKSGLLWYHKILKIKSYQQTIHRIKERAQKLKIRFYISRARTIPIHLRSTYIVSCYERFLLTFQPEKITTKVLLFRASKTESDDISLGWGNYVDEMEIINLNGNHQTILTNAENTNIISEKVAQFIGRENLQYA